MGEPNDELRITNDEFTAHASGDARGDSLRVITFHASRFTIYASRVPSPRSR